MTSFDLTWLITHVRNAVPLTEKNYPGRPEDSEAALVFNINHALRHNALNVAVIQGQLEKFDHGRENALDPDALRVAAVKLLVSATSLCEMLNLGEAEIVGLLKTYFNPPN